MDTTALFRWLHSTMATPAGAAGRRILRFQSPGEYRAFAAAWATLAHPQSYFPEVKPLPLINGIACPAVSSPPPTAGFRLTQEEDPEVALLGTVQKRSVGADKGIPWGVQHVRAPYAWSRTTGHRIKIGVIDTGVDFGHPDLAGSLARGINLLSRGSAPHDDNGHGTHIAGTIAAANQPKGMIGVAPRSIVHPVKAFDHNGSAYVSDIILGIEWCVRNRLHIINMSFGMKNRSKALLGAVNHAYHAGIVIVASSGNDGKRKSIDYPARYPQTISVGATNRLRRIAPFSNRGSYIDIYAPGDKIHSAWLKGAYHEMSGTSMATSHVSGAIALLLAERPGLAPAEIKAILRRAMQPIRGQKSSRMAGELDIVKMLQAADR
ncbi:S8 family peptidase [Paenibacillus sp. 1P07SE]|uniref:S8 family peptidase n=1 Tax=Paenibacillus sp. 1P07SE TaxID=3132209 RepID=UPI0039A4890E